MEKRRLADAERMLDRDYTARGVGEVACNGLKPKDLPTDVIVTHYTVTLNGQTRRFVMLVPKEA